MFPLVIIHRLILPSSKNPLLVRKSSYSKRIKYSEDFVTMAKTNPFLAISLGVTFFSIAGVPPFVGFFSKMFLFLVLLVNRCLI